MHEIVNTWGQGYYAQLKVNVYLTIKRVFNLLFCEHQKVGAMGFVVAHTTLTSIGI